MRLCYRLTPAGSANENSPLASEYFFDTGRALSTYRPVVTDPRSQGPLAEIY